MTLTDRKKIIHKMYSTIKGIQHYKNEYSIETLWESCAFLTDKKLVEEWVKLSEYRKELMDDITA